MKEGKVPAMFVVVTFTDVNEFVKRHRNVRSSFE